MHCLKKKLIEGLLNSTLYKKVYTRNLTIVKRKCEELCENDVKIADIHVKLASTNIIESTNRTKFLKKLEEFICWYHRKDLNIVWKYEKRTIYNVTLV